MSLAVAAALAVALVTGGCGPTEEPPASTEPTWHGDIHPIIEARCGGCHVQGGIAPFALSTFEQAQTHALAIADAVVQRRMPPWMPSDDCQSFHGSRRMPQEEIDQIARWVALDSPEGSPPAAPPAPAKLPSLAWVDAEVSADEDYLPPDGASDDYRCLIAETGVTSARDLIGFEILPGSTRTVHHVILYAMDREEAQQRDSAEAGLGYTCFGGPGGSPRMVGAWAPGSGAVVLPRSTGMTLYSDDVLVMQVHYNLSSAREPDRTKVALQFAQQPRPLKGHMFPLPADDFRLAPRSTDQSTTLEYEVPLPITLWGVMPHMHLLGRSIRLEVERAGGEEACLIDIPKWQFHWQQSYFYTDLRGIPLNEGDRVRLTCTWDNPTDREITWGEGTADEMCLMLIYVTSGG